MFIQIAAILVTYVGVKLYDKHKEKPTPQQETPQREEEQKPEKANTALTTLPQPQTPRDTANGTGNAVKRYQEYRDMCALTIALLAFSPVFPVLGLYALMSYGYTIIPYLKDVEKALVKDRKVNVDVLFFSAHLLAMGIGQYFAANFGVWLWYSGKLGIEKTRDHSQHMLTSVFEQLPQQVWAVIDHVEVAVPLQDVKPDDILAARTGDAIPVDGLIIKGMASIDQRALTGESQPAEKGIGDQVYANTVILNGSIHIQVEQAGQETRAAQIRDILLHATDFKSNVQLKGEAWAEKATLPMLAAAGAVVPTFGPQAAVVFIRSHIGTRIRFCAPLGTLKHITMAAQKQILVKDGRALEGLCEVDTILFDKTGTLTTEEPEVARIIPYAQYTRHDILGFAAMAEGKLNHPLARAIVKKAEDEHVISQDIQESTYQIGYGMTVMNGKTPIRVGSSRFLSDEGITIPDPIQEVMSEVHDNGNTLVFVALDHHVGGVIELQPRVRPEVKAIISRLRQQGISHCAIISGDHSGPTQALAETLGMDTYFADVLPEDKARIVKQLQQEQRTVCFIGDGINDTLAMQQANVSISLAGATTIATDVADIVFMDGSLVCLNDLFDISHHLDADLKKYLKLIFAAGGINLAGAFLLNFSVMTSMLVSYTLGGIVMADIMKPVKNLSDWHV